MPRRIGELLSLFANFAFFAADHFHRIFAADELATKNAKSIK